MAFEYAVYGLVTDPGSVPAAEYAAWLTDWLWVVMMAPLTTFALLLFPTGSLPSWRWRPVAWLAAAGIVLTGAGAALGPGAIEEFDAAVVENPVGIAALDGIYVGIVAAGMISIGAATVASAASLFLRLRRSEGVERLQMKWFVYAAALAALGVVITICGYAVSEEVGQKAVYALLSLFGLPIAAAVAILRYRLYDIDLIINRTLVYASLTAVLAGLYSASITLFRFLFEAIAGGSSQATIVLTTLVLAAMFTPIKNRLQSLVDRHVGRATAPRKELEEFADQLRVVIRALDAEATLREFATLAMRAGNASGAAVYLSNSGGEEPLFAEGRLDAGWLTRLPLTAKGEEMAWLELAGPPVNGAMDQETRESLEAAASVVGMALVLSGEPPPNHKPDISPSAMSAANVLSQADSVT
jgi:hypothetical protein